ncbi:class I SAM-dependent methyltransferase [Aliiglaciecola sp. M165]|uniref:class I SAM-dependent methyltransferase n=1 Tax=Aliiglaciecola sp. M165 TaxID=2593649 RepID=UPI0011809CAE|nr:class I SAM-dependent methyltransferase [Aliiglaciecola sp. M165]TRY34022.1 class I SAM-dependent methyltransferase [Aliiglaciecola sp. M165]
MDTLSLVLADPQSADLQAKAAALEKNWGLKKEPSMSSGLVLFLERHQLSLRQLDEPKLGAVFVDFASDALTFRRLHSGGKKESIAKAVGVKGAYAPSVIDATAGLGKDAFVLASLGCHVEMIERSPVVAALLEDGLNRAGQSTELSQWLPERMKLFHGPSYTLLNDWQGNLPDVVYLDPMFPHRKKSALVKKEMRLFQQMLGPDEDADKLLAPALKLATKRVVVKRPESAPFLDGKEPNMQIKGKKLRFDVYFTQLL